MFISIVSERIQSGIMLYVRELFRLMCGSGYLNPFMFMTCAIKNILMLKKTISPASNSCKDIIIFRLPKKKCKKNTYNN